MGAHRAASAVPTLPPGGWSDVSRPAEWLGQASDSDTPVVDSLGRALDACQQSAIGGNPFYRMRGADTPTPQGWGALWTAFTRWLRQVRQGFGGQVVIVAHARESRDADGKPAGWRIDGTGSSVSEVAQEGDMIGFVERPDDEHVGVAWFPGHGGRDVTGKNPGLPPKLGCVADDADFLQRIIDRTRERIGARHRATVGIVADRPNHPRGESDRPKRQPQPAVAASVDAPGNCADAVDDTYDIPFWDSLDIYIRVVTMNGAEVEAAMADPECAQAKECCKWAALFVVRRAVDARSLRRRRVRGAREGSRRRTPALGRPGLGARKMTHLPFPVGRLET